MTATAPKLEAVAGGLEEAALTSWAPVDLGPVLDGGTDEPPPIVLRRLDGVPLLYAGKIHVFAGEPEAGKGWIALAAACEVLERGGRALYIDGEDSAAGVAGRLLNLGVPRQAIVERFVYVRPDDPWDEEAGAILATVGAVDLAVIDGVTEILTLMGLSGDSNDDVARYRSTLVRPLAKAGAAVVEIDHVTKNKEARGGFALGAQIKKAGIDGAMYTLVKLQPFARGKTGKTKIVVEKDRPGHVREHQAGDGAIAVAHLVSCGDGAVRVELLSPEDEPPRRLTHLMEQVSRHLETYPDLTTVEIRAAIQSRGEYVDKAVRFLIAEDHVRVRQEGRKHLHACVKPYREADDDRA